MNLKKETQDTICYHGRYAQLYDIFYKDKPYEKEAAFVDSCMKQYLGHGKKKIIELACGTGRHAIELAQKGHAIIATDISEDMLNQARQRARLAGVEIDFRIQDMRQLDVKEKPFDVALCLFDSIGFVITNEGVCQTIKNVVSHLQNNGLFICEFWHGPAMLMFHEPLRIRHYDSSGQDILRISETAINYFKQICHVKYTVYEHRANGSFSSIVEHQANRFFFVQEMANFLNMSGLAPEAWYAGFSPDQEITQNVWHIVAVARKIRQIELPKYGI